MKAHLQRNLDRRRAVGAVEAVTEIARRDAGQALGELDHRTLRQAGEHHVLEIVELGCDRRVDLRMRVPEQVDPPRADGVEIAAAVEIVKPRTAAPRNRNQGPGLVPLHLRARVPDGGTAAGDPRGVARRRDDGCRFQFGRHDGRIIIAAPGRLASR